MKVSREIRAKAVTTAGAASIATGVGVLAGWEWSAITAGGYVVVLGAFLIDTDEPAEGDRRRRRVIERGRR